MGKSVRKCEKKGGGEGCHEKVISHFFPPSVQTERQKRGIKKKKTAVLVDTSYKFFSCLLGILLSISIMSKRGEGLTPHIFRRTVRSPGLAIGCVEYVCIG